MAGRDNIYMYSMGRKPRKSGQISREASKKLIPCRKICYCNYIIGLCNF